MPQILRLSHPAHLNHLNLEQQLNLPHYNHLIASGLQHQITPGSHRLILHIEPLSSSDDAYRVDIEMHETDRSFSTNPTIVPSKLCWKIRNPLELPDSVPASRLEAVCRQTLDKLVHWLEQAHFWLQLLSQIDHSCIPLIDPTLEPLNASTVLIIDDCPGFFRVDLVIDCEFTAFVAHRVSLVNGKWQYWSSRKALPLFPFPTIPQPTSLATANQIHAQLLRTLAPHINARFQC